jgi:hypothetical protein
VLLLVCANAKAAGDRSGIEPVPERVAVSPGSVRVLQLVFPMSGPYKGRVSNFDW